MTQHVDHRTVPQQLMGMARAIALRATGNNIETYDPATIPDQRIDPAAPQESGADTQARVREFVQTTSNASKEEKKALLKKLDKNRLVLNWQLGALDTDLRQAFGDEYTLDEALLVVEALLRKYKS